MSNEPLSVALPRLLVSPHNKEASLFGCFMGVSSEYRRISAPLFSGMERQPLRLFSFSLEGGLDSLRLPTAPTCALFFPRRTLFHWCILSIPVFPSQGKPVNPRTRASNGHI